MDMLGATLQSTLPAVCRSGTCVGAMPLSCQLTQNGDCALAVMAPSSPQTHTQAAGSLVEAATSGEGQEGKGEGKKEKRMRRKKDPAAPKKALTGYLVFINSKREQVIREHPEADLKDQVPYPYHSLHLTHVVIMGDHSEFKGIG